MIDLWKSTHSERPFIDPDPLFFPLAQLAAFPDDPHLCLARQAGYFRSAVP